MSIARNTGLAPNGDQIAGNVLPDVLLDYRAFSKGQDCSQHSESWAVDVTDRLDAEHYAKESDREPVDIAAITQDLHKREESSATINSMLAGETSVIETLQTTPLKLGDVLEEVSNREAVKQDKLYRMMGVRWWGEGSFIREEKRGKEIKGKTLYAVTPADLAS